MPIAFLYLMQQKAWDSPGAGKAKCLDLMAKYLPSDFWSSCCLAVYQRLLLQTSWICSFCMALITALSCSNSLGECIILSFNKLFTTGFSCCLKHADNAIATQFCSRGSMFGGVCRVWCDMSILIEGLWLIASTNTAIKQNFHRVIQDLLEILFCGA